MDELFSRLDPDQLAAVRLRKNGAVSAGAGSGKTTVLAARYVDLVLGADTDVRSILCLTFTRKAAAEMRARIWKELAQHPSEKAKTEAARFSEATVTTIDSFCGSVLRSSAQRYGYPPDFGVDDKAAKALARSEALSFLLERREDPALRELFAYQGFMTAWEELFAKAGHRYASPVPERGHDLADTPERARAALLRMGRKALKELELARGEAAELGDLGTKAGTEFLAALTALPGDLRELLHLASAPADGAGAPPLPGSSATRPAAATPAAAAPAAATPAAAAPVVAAPVAATPAAAAPVVAAPVVAAPVVAAPAAAAQAATSLPDLGAVIAAFEGAAGRTASIAGLGLRFGKGDDGPRDRLKKAASDARDAARRLQAYSAAARNRRLEDSIVSLVSDFAKRLVEAKRRAGIMGFHDVIVATVDLLASDPQIRSYWKDRYRWIMVDEFQDDDELQKELFFLLAERPERRDSGHPAATELAPDKLFFVGDDKQSIYRFRGADVSVFNRLGRELAEGDKASIAPAATGKDGGGLPEAVDSLPKLRTNYRSEPGLVAFFNEVFSRLLAGRDAADYEARHEETISRGPTPGVVPKVRLLLKSKGRSEEGIRSNDEAMAEAVARELRNLVDSGTCLVPDGQGGCRPVAWNDVAILLRSSSKQYLVERFLRLHDIPHGAASVRSLFVESPANDLLAVLRLALFPGDRTALATFLRSPFVRLSEEAFVTVLAEDREFAAAEPDSLDLSPVDRERLALARGLLAELGARIDRLPLAGLLSWLWHERGLRLSLVSDPASHSFLEHFDWLFALAVDADRNGESLAAFVDRISPLLGSPEKLDDELEAPRESRGGVQIMTIHKSKGLEFPIVVIPWMENKGQGERKGEAWYESAEVGLSLNLRDWRDPQAKRTNIFFDAASGEEKAKALAEAKRLFYVACTRASVRLVFAGILPGTVVPEGSFLHFLGLRSGVADAPPPGMPEGVELARLPDLGEEEYRRLAARSGGLTPTGYESAETIDRSRPGRIVPATAINLVAWEGNPRRGEAAATLPSLAYDKIADRVPENRFGDLCHAVLEARILGRELDPTHEAFASLPGDLKSMLVDEASRLADAFFSAPLSRLLAGAEELLVEKAVLLSVDDLVIRARLDLAIVREDEVIIVDWKSGREAQGAAYAVQLALYRHAMEALRPGRRVRSLLWWLRAGTEEEIDQEFAASELAAWAESASRLGEDAAEAAEIDEICAIRPFLPGRA